MGYYVNFINFINFINCTKNIKCLVEEDESFGWRSIEEELMGKW